MSSHHVATFQKDGYVFNQTERESLNIGKTNAENVSTNRRSASRALSTQQPAQPTPDPLISNELIWKAFLSLEVISRLVRSHLDQIAWLDFIVSQRVVGDMTIVSSIAKAASDLATISSSNRERILHVVLTAHDDQPPETLETGAENTGDAPTAALAAKFADSLSIGVDEIPLCDAGVATWLSFKCILSLVKSLKKSVASSEMANQSTTDSDTRQAIVLEILNESFGPSVSVLQHYVKRMSGSHVVVSQTLLAYEELASASMVVDCKQENLRRQAIVTSLCKLCLPSWGKKRSHW